MLKKIVWSLIVILLLTVGYFWLNRDAWLHHFNSGHQAVAKEYRQRGADYGRDHDQQACLDKAMRDFDSQCSGYSCTIRYGVFLRGCLETAQTSPQFCKGVPPYHEKLTEMDKYWAKHLCWGKNIRGDGCVLLLHQQQLLCTTGSLDPAAYSPASGASEAEH